jgi:CxxC-x17-CxxC domain-containing protein
MARPDVVYFAKTNFRGAERTFGVRREDRRQHVYVIGKTGTGKTNLLKALALQDIANGDGIGIVDPHGSFVEELIEQIPENRLEDVIYFNPADADHPIGFNVLEVPDPQYKHLVASDLMGIFTKIWANVWSARMEHILNNCVLALIDTPGTTLLGIPRILVDKDYRSKIINNVKDPVVRSFWTQEYEGYTDRLRSEAIVPIQNKVGQFLSSSLIRNIVGQPTSTINIPDIMNQRKILLVNVAKGRIGEDNADLLGAMVITKIQLAAMERVRIKDEEKRKDFFLFVDEFQNFATESFADILSEARKYRLNLTLAHQYIGQLVTETTTKVRDAVFGNCGTLIVFRVGAADAEFLENEFSPEFNIQDLVNLPNKEVYVKLMVNGVTSRPFSAETIFAKAEGGVENSEELITKMTRRKYSRPRVEVEAEIEGWSVAIGDENSEHHGGASGSSAATKGERYTALCSVCGKTAHVNFKPDESRPVYCSECLKKVQAGEIRPVKIVPKARFAESLGELGIEFKDEKHTNTEHRERREQVGHMDHKGERREYNRQDRKKSAPSIKKGSYVVKQSGPRSVSLRELSKSPHKRRQPDISNLKSAIKKALEPKFKLDSKTNIRPGQTIKLQ